MSRSSTLLTVTAGVAVSGLVAYALYFDYKRRTDVNFRKRLRMSLSSSACTRLTRFRPGKEKKRAEKSQTPSEASASIGGVDPNELASALENIRNEEVPTDHDQKHQYFMAQVNMGETLSVKGPSRHVLPGDC
jgi:mitochondrial import receptor subunit TOM20